MKWIVFYIKKKKKCQTAKKLVQTHFFDFNKFQTITPKPKPTMFQLK